VDPVTHSLTGAALSRTGLHRATPLATAALVLGANAPDIDIMTYLQGGTYSALAARRGITHGPLALLLLPLLVAAGVLIYDRIWRRRRRPADAPVRAGPILLLALIGALTHAPLDWLNTYGIRLLMPFSDRWFYGDAVFIIDPWIWLALAVPVVPYATSRRGRLLSVVLGIVATLMVMLAPQVPLAARVVWALLAGALGAYTALVWRRGTPPPDPQANPTVGDGRRRRAAVAALLFTAAYIGGMLGSDQLARRETMRAAEGAGLRVEDLMVAPVPANPFAAELVVETAGEYQLGRFDWLGSPRVRWTRPIAKGERTPEVLATLQLQEVRDFLRWSRYPYVEVREDDDGRYVRFGDARYPSRMRGGLSGIVVRVEGMPRVQP
jgi:inner membrane protein